MLNNPFTLFTPYSDQLRVAFFDKADDAPSDQEAASALGMDRAAGLHQEHGNRTIIVHDALERSEKADGMLTDEKNLALCIRGADCQIFVIYAPDHHVLGVLHCGWRGIKADAITAFYQQLKEEWSIEPGATLVGAGRSLCQNCAGFQQGDEILGAVDARYIDADNHVDLVGIADDTLVRLGVGERNLERDPRCTRCNPKTLWTYRGGTEKQCRVGRRICSLFPFFRAQ